MFERLFEAVQHANAFVVLGAEPVIGFLVDVAFQLSDVQVVYDLKRFTTRAVHAFDSIADVAVVVFLCQLRGRAI